MAMPEFLSPGASFSIGGGTNIGTIVANVVADIGNFTMGFAKATTQLGTFSGKINSFMAKNVTAMRRMGMQAIIVGTAVTAGLGGMVKSYGDFEQRMRRAAAVSETTEGQFQRMSAMAEKASMDLNIAATQAADAFYYLGSAGLSTVEQIEAFPAVATLSKAAVINMNEAAEMLVDTMGAFGKEFKDAGPVTDKLTAGVISSNMTFTHLGATLGLVGSVASATNNSIAETVALIGLMANVGIKGTNAGTSLRRALLNLQAPSSDVRKELQKWSVDAYDAERNMKPYIQIIAELGEAMKNATEE